MQASNGEREWDGLSPARSARHHSETVNTVVLVGRSTASRAATTQTDPKPSLLHQVMLRLLANQEFRNKRESEAKGRGVIVNSSSRSDVRQQTYHIKQCLIIASLPLTQTPLSQD